PALARPRRGPARLARLGGDEGAADELDQALLRIAAVPLLGAVAARDDQDRALRGEPSTAQGAQPCLDATRERRTALEIEAQLRSPLASAVLRSRSKRSCAAVATLLTFWPPGPAERTNESDNSLSGISTPSATRSDKSGALQGRTLVGRPVETHRFLRDRRGRRLHRARPED